jgi:hypothetical protein
MEQPNVVEMAKNLADNINFLIIKLAEKIQDLENENADLKKQLGAQNNDAK